MQLGAVNNVNFKSSKYDLPKLDERETREFIENIRDLEDTFVPTKKDDESEKKSFLQATASVAALAAIITAAGAYTYKRGGALLGKLKDSTIANNVKNLGVTKNIEEAAGKVAKKVGNAAKKISNKKFIQPSIKFAKGIDETLNKTIGKTLKAGLYTSAVATPIIASTDKDDNGVADILEKGVNLYEGVANKFNKFAKVIELLG